jgi:alkylation response protein AidB-like acyl-CoA dehydrogenase
MNEEFARAGVPRATRGMGEWLVGPSIIVWGTDEQKARFLPRIIDGTDRYCQGFSEPDAGSDLAGLKTRGEVDGDIIRINGQKVWTSGAQAANMMFCLCRTDPDAPKHRGISYVLLPMFTEDGSSNGIELRPIKQITGSAHFTETFLTDAIAPVANVIGGLHNGWRVTMTTLGNERGGNATTQHVQYQQQLAEALDLARKLGRDTDPVVRQQLATAFTKVEIMRYQGLRLLSEVVARKEPGPASALNKMLWS